MMISFFVYDESGRRRTDERVKDRTATGGAGERGCRFSDAVAKRPEPSEGRRLKIGGTAMSLRREEGPVV
jgi:hypothetical protein